MIAGGECRKRERRKAGVTRKGAPPRSGWVAQVRVHLSAQTRTWLACAFRRSASLFDDGSKSFLASSWLAKLGRMRAPRERFCLSARGLILSPLPRAGEVASEASGRGTVAAVLSQAATPPHPDLLPARGEKEGERAAKRFCLSAPARSARGTARQRGGGGMRRFVRSDRQSKRRRPRPFHRPSGGPPSPPCGAGWEITCDEN